MEWDHRWDKTRDVLAVVAEASPQFDSDGVDLYFLNSDVFRKHIRVCILAFASFRRLTILKTRDGVIQLFNEVAPDGTSSSIIPSFESLTMKFRRNSYRKQAG